MLKRIGNSDWHSRIVIGIQSYVQSTHATCKAVQGRDSFLSRTPTQSCVARSLAISSTTLNSVLLAEPSLSHCSRTTQAGRTRRVITSETIQAIHAHIADQISEKETARRVSLKVPRVRGLARSGILKLNADLYSATAVDNFLEVVSARLWPWEHSRRRWPSLPSTLQHRVPVHLTGQFFKEIIEGRIAVSSPPMHGDMRTVFVHPDHMERWCARHRLPQRSKHLGLVSNRITN